MRRLVLWVPLILFALFAIVVGVVARRRAGKRAGRDEDG